MTRRDKPFTPKKLRIRHVDRMAAAREILRRGFGHFGRKRKLVVDDHDDNIHDTNDYDTLHTDLAKRMREYTEHGTEAVRFLLDVMEDANPDEPYTWHHRMSAAHELLRRGWDTNYDAITPEMLQDYWHDQQSTRLSVGQKKQLAGLPTTLDDYNTYDNTDYQAQAQEIREAQDHEAISPVENSPLSLRVRVKSPAESPSKKPAERESGNPAEQGASTETTNSFVLSQSKNLPPARSVDESASNRKNTDRTNPIHLVSYPDDDKPDCYYEPLNPDDETAFNRQQLIESGEYEEGEISIAPPSKEAWKAHKIALRQIREIAEAEGVPHPPQPPSRHLQAPTHPQPLAALPIRPFPRRACP